MKHKRIYVRVPLNGDAVLTNSSHRIKARAIDISQGGVAITAFSEELVNNEYQFEIITESGQTIEAFAQLICVEAPVARFKILHIEQNSLEVIRHLIFEYQNSIDFIKQFDECNLHKVLDTEGNEIEFTFEKGK